MKQYAVSGMSCAACAARVERAVKKVPGVTSCAVSLLTNSMGVEGSASPEEIISAVSGAGYGAAEKGGAAGTEADSLEDKESPLLKKRLAASLILLVPLMYISMGYMMWGWPLPAFFDENYMAVGLAQMLLSAAVMIINQKFFINGFAGLAHRAPNMDTLVALGSSAAFVWSAAVLFMMTGAGVKGDDAAAAALMHDLYFESAAMILALITVGKLLEARSKGKTTDALRSLMSLTPKTAVIMRDGREVTVPADRVRPGDVFIVRPGETVPVDGVVKEGESAVNEAALTGESMPADKSQGDSVTAASINLTGFLKCEASRVGEDTTLSQIIKTVSEAAAAKAPIAKTADRVSAVFVPAVIIIAVITSAVWMLSGRDPSFSLARGISVLVISCPCALGLATPVAIMAGSGVGARNGILFKTAVSLEQAGKTDIVVLDKTGTITQGSPVVTDILPAEGISDSDLLTMALALETKSEHPLAGAVKEAGKGLTVPEVSGFTVLPGNGLTAVMGDTVLAGGSMSFIQSRIDVPRSAAAGAEALAEEGKTPLLFARGNEYLGIIAAADAVKPDSPEAIRSLQNMGMRVIMVTGDNERTARAVGRTAGVTEIVAGVLPDGKEKVVRSLMEEGNVAMAGDGINDAPALTAAHTGIAIGAGADVAIDAADIVLMNSSLMDVAAAIRLSRAALRNIKQNLFWAFFYNIIGIPLAAGCFAGMGLTISPVFCAAAMSLSSFCVVTNALRLNLIRFNDSDREDNAACKEPAPPRPERNEDLTCIIRIEGMMCRHCEEAVEEALGQVPGVVSAAASHEAGTAAITCRGEVDRDKIKKAVEDEDFTFISME